MKLIKTQEAVGHVLCHDITRIVRGVVKDVAFRKGHVVVSEDIPLLLELGKEHLYVWENHEGMLHENDAAVMLYELCAGGNEFISATPVKEGKIEAVALSDGLFYVDTGRLDAVNSLGRLAIATRLGNRPVRRGDKLAGMRIIPLVIEREALDTARLAAGIEPIVRLYPYKRMNYAIITTGSEISGGLIEDTFTPVIREKLAVYDVCELGHVTPGDDAEKITNAILGFSRQGADLILCTGGMSVDPDDRTPLAIRNTGADVISYGAPVLPGNMLMLAYLNESKTTVMGLPGCVMYAGRTVFDLLLPRVAAGRLITAGELAAMGHGGLCLSCEHCIFPGCGFGSGS